MTKQNTKSTQYCFIPKVNLCFTDTVHMVILFPSFKGAMSPYRAPVVRRSRRSRCSHRDWHQKWQRRPSRLQPPPESPKQRPLPSATHTAWWISYLYVTLLNLSYDAWISYFYESVTWCVSKRWTPKNGNWLEIVWVTLLNLSYELDKWKTLGQGLIRNNTVEQHNKHAEHAYNNKWRGLLLTSTA